MPTRRSLTIVFLALVVVLACAMPSGARYKPRCRGRVATIVGTRNGDRLKGTSQDDAILAGAGDDAVTGAGGDDVICGGKGNDSLLGGHGDDRVFGGRGLDTFESGRDRGNDFYGGGLNTDLLDASAPSATGEPHGSKGPAFVDLSLGVARQKGVGRDTIVKGSIEDVYGSSQGDTIIGDTNDNTLNAGQFGHGTLRGGPGDDILSTGEDGGTTFRGGAGQDSFNAFPGNNVVYGGVGTDTLAFCHARGGSTSLPVSVDLAAGRSTIKESGFTDRNRLQGIENAYTCHGDDDLRGDDGPNSLRSGGGDDRLEGRDGDDSLSAGKGNDSADGGDGTDSCYAAETKVACE